MIRLFYGKAIERRLKQGAEQDRRFLAVVAAAVAMPFAKKGANPVGDMDAKLQQVMQDEEVRKEKELEQAIGGLMTRFTNPRKK